MSVTDSLDGIEVFHSSDVDNYSRGEIREKTGHKVIVPSMGFIQEHVFEKTDPKAVLDTFPEDGFVWSDYDVAFSLEGCLLRLYQWNGVWRVSTHKKIDAFDSRWGSPMSFGHAFSTHLQARQASLDKLTSSLNEKHVYLILMLHGVENRIAYNPLPGKNHLVFLGFFDEEKVWHSSPLALPKDDRSVFDPIPPAETILDGFARLTLALDTTSNDEASKTWKQVFQEKIDPTRHQGFLLLPRANHYQIHYKIYHPEYYRKMSLRGNQSNAILRYFELSDPVDQKDYFNIYPELQIPINGSLAKVNQVFHILYDFYLARFIYKKYVVLPRFEYRIILQFHMTAPEVIQPLQDFMAYWYKNLSTADKMSFLLKTVPRYLPGS